jgi:hypothetical protein
MGDGVRRIAQFPEIPFENRQIIPRKYLNLSVKMASDAVSANP